MQEVDQEFGVNKKDALKSSISKLETRAGISIIDHHNQDSDSAQSQSQDEDIEDPNFHDQLVSPKLQAEDEAV